MDRTNIDRCFATDRISNLPRDVVDHIFTCLPLRDVVRTSILSREWRYKWVTIPNLVFGFDFKRSLLPKYNLESTVYQILLLHQGPIVKFAMKVNDFKSCQVINNCVNFLSSHHRIEELVLRFSYPKIPHKVPCHLFSFDNLHHLYLAYCELKPPSSFNGFGKLVRLHLQNVQTAPGDLSVFISKCPLLEYLNLYSDEVFDTALDLEIDAPNLKSFQFLGILSSICFKNASHLVDISLCCYHQYPELEIFEDSEIFQPHENVSNISKVLGQLSSVQRLITDGGFLQFLAIGGVPKKLPNILNRLTFLQLPDVYFDNIVDVTSVLCLIRSCPILQSLEITPRYFHGGIERTTIFLEEQQKFKIPLNHLKIVKFHSFSGWKPEMELVKIILSAAIVLRKLEIKSPYAAVTKKGSEILRGLARFPRASSQAEFIFEDPSGR